MRAHEAKLAPGTVEHGTKLSRPSIAEAHAVQRAAAEQKRGRIDRHAQRSTLRRIRQIQEEAQILGQKVF
jgi:hypothetical protein